MTGQAYHVHACECGLWTPCTLPGDAYSHGTDCESCGGWIPPVGHLCWTDDTLCSQCGAGPC